MGKVMEAWYDKWADFSCPTCDEYFNFKFQQHEHAAKWKHQKLELCSTRHPQGRGCCKRAKDHGGWHAYPGSQYVVMWVDKMPLCHCHDMVVHGTHSHECLCKCHAEVKSNV